MPHPGRDALDRRDEALWRTRRLSWVVAGGAACASVVLGAAFAQALPGHDAPAAGPGGGSGLPASAGTHRGGTPGTGPVGGAGTSSPAGSAGNASAGRSGPSRSQAPAPVPAATPQGVSGGS